MTLSVTSDLGLHGLLRHVCPNTHRYVAFAVYFLIYDIQNKCSKETLKDMVTDN